MAGPSFGCIPNLLEECYLGIQDVDGNVEPLPTLVPHDQYKSTIVVYSLEMNADVFVAMMQDLTKKAARQYQAEMWSYAIQWSHNPGQCAHDAAKPAENADDIPKGPTPSKQLQLGTNQPVGQTTVAANQAKGKKPIPRIDKRVLDPNFFQEEGVVRLLLDIVQIDSTLVPNIIEILYRWIDNSEGDGTALRAALQREIPSLFDFDYHPIDISKYAGRELQRKQQDKGPKLPMPKNPKAVGGTNTHPLVDPYQGGDRHLYRQVKFGIQPPKVSSSIPPLINIPENHTGRTKYYGACFKSRQTALQILNKIGLTSAQIGHYVRNQTTPPKQCSKDGDWKTLPGFKHYFKDATASQEYFRAERSAQQAQEKQCEVARSSRLALEAAVAAGEISWEDAKEALLPEKPYPNRRDDVYDESDEEDKPRMKIGLIPHPLIGQLKSKVFEGATSEEALVEKKHKIREQVRLKAEQINQRLKHRIAQDSDDEDEGETERMKDFDDYVERQELSDWYKRQKVSNTTTVRTGSPPSQSTTQPPTGQGLFSSVTAGLSASGASGSSGSVAPPPVSSFPTVGPPRFASATASTNAPSQGLSLSSLGQAFSSGTAGQGGLSGTSTSGTGSSLFSNTASTSGTAGQAGLSGASTPGTRFSLFSNTASTPGTTSSPFANIASSSGTAGQAGLSGTSASGTGFSLFSPTGSTSAVPTNAYSQGSNLNPYAHLAPQSGYTTASTNAESQGPSTNPFVGWGTTPAGSTSAAPASANNSAPSNPFAHLASSGGSTSSASASANNPTAPSNSTGSAFQTSAFTQSGSAGASTQAQSSNAPEQAASSDSNPEDMTATDLATDLDGDDTSPATAEEAEDFLGRYRVGQLQHGSTFGIQQLNAAATQNVTTPAPASATTPAHQMIDLDALMQATGTSTIYELSRLLHRRRQEGRPIDLDTLKHEGQLRKLGVPASTPSNVLNARRSGPNDRSMTIVLHFPNVLVPANGLGPNGTRLGNDDAAETDALLIGTSKPGSGRIYFERAIYLPIGISRTMRSLTSKGNWLIVETYYRSSAQQVGETGYAHKVAHAHLAAAFSFMSSCALSREDRLTKRWRVTPGMMSSTQRGSIWEGYAITMRGRDWAWFRLRKQARHDAARNTWEIDGEEVRATRLGVDREEMRAISMARRAEIEQMLEENEDEEDEGWEDDGGGGGEDDFEPDL